MNNMDRFGNYVPFHNGLPLRSWDNIYPEGDILPVQYPDGSIRCHFFPKGSLGLDRTIFFSPMTQPSQTFPAEGLNLQQQIALKQLEQKILETQLQSENIRNLPPYQLMFHHDASTSTTDLIYFFPERKNICTLSHESNQRNNEVCLPHKGTEQMEVDLVNTQNNNFMSASRTFLIKVDVINKALSLNTGTSKDNLHPKVMFDLPPSKQASACTIKEDQTSKIEEKKSGCCRAKNKTAGANRSKKKFVAKKRNKKTKDYSESSETSSSECS